MIDEKRIADFFAELVSIDSPSLEEREMADTLKIKFAEIGVTLTEDHTQEQTGSNAGNLFARIPGSLAGAPVLFAAHMDTVEPAKGKKAVSHEDGTVTRKSVDRKSTRLNSSHILISRMPSSA